MPTVTEKTNMRIEQEWLLPEKSFQQRCSYSDLLSAWEVKHGHEIKTQWKGVEQMKSLYNTIKYNDHLHR